MKFVENGWDLVVPINEYLLKCKYVLNSICTEQIYILGIEKMGWIGNSEIQILLKLD